MCVLFPGSGRCLGGGNDNPVQYSCLGDPIDRGAWWLRSMGSQRVGPKLAIVHCHSSHSFAFITLHLGSIIDLEGLEPCSCLNLFYTFSFRLPEWFSHACCCKDAIYVQERAYQHWLGNIAAVMGPVRCPVTDSSQPCPNIWLLRIVTEGPIWEKGSGSLLDLVSTGLRRAQWWPRGPWSHYSIGVLRDDVPLLVFKWSLSPISLSWTMTKNSVKSER